MQVNSHALIFKDFETTWYEKWAKQLKQDNQHLDNHMLRANKFWQNAVMVQALWERGALQSGNQGLGFGVGQERLPALFAKLGVNVMATDQDFKTKKAGYWAKHELATSAQSLNKLGICDPKIFAQQVSYMPMDMTKIPADLHGKYDFLWSNCALGHLGSIPASLEFIEDSLKCLKPGGWAVHTTEANVLSNDDTVTTGNTVIFRLKDIYKLSKRLSKKGYICEPLNFYLGRSKDDTRLSMRPEFGNDFSKIQVSGHLLTQIVLIIHKPQKSPKRIGNKLALYRAYKKGLAEIRDFKNENPNLKQIFTSQEAPFSSVHINSLKKNININVPKGKTTDLYVEFKNNSKINLYGINYHLAGIKPIVLATDNPRDRKSAFTDKSWVGTNDNRPAADLWVQNQKGKYVYADHIGPQQKFAFKLTLNTNNLKPGSYKEAFSIVQEQVGWIDDTLVQISVKVT